jgi:RNA polymerase sigma factor (sigma-70 family)
LNWENVDDATAAANDDTIIALHEALEKLADGDPQTAELVKLRYFAEMTVGDAAGALGLSARTAERRLAYARAWLGREMERAPSI